MQSPAPFLSNTLLYCNGLVCRRCLCRPRLTISHALSARPAPSVNRRKQQLVVRLVKRMLSIDAMVPDESSKCAVMLCECKTPV